MNALEELAESFSRLPGIGKKSATRIATHLLKADSGFLQRFAHQLTTLQERIKPCSICGAYTEVEPCWICSNPARDRNVICVVNGQFEVLRVELDPIAVDPRDVPMLQDLIVAASRDAHTRMQELMKERLGPMMGGLNIPGMGM